MPSSSAPDARSWPAGHPPEPWRLLGHLHLGVWLVPRAQLPSVEVPGATPLVIGRLGVVGTAWVVYEPGGVLSYDELMVTVLVRQGWRPLPCVTSIWVDSPVSRDGGRALWGIPKELARFEVDSSGDDRGTSFGAEAEDGPLGSVTLHGGAALPWRVPFRFSVLQSLAGRAKRSPVSGWTGVSLEGGTWDLPDRGPLAVLRGRRPLLEIALTGFVMLFGSPEGFGGPEGAGGTDV